MTDSPAANSPAHHLLPALFAALAGAMVLGLCIGPVPATLNDLLAAIGITDAPGREYARTALLELRLPRVLLAAMTGATLGVCGAAIQGLFRNPLAEPGLIGVSAGAALGAVLVLVIMPAAMPGLLVPIAACFGAGATVWLVLRIARRAGRTHVATALLAGVAINAIAGASIGVLTYIADDSALRSLTFWLFGSLGRADWPMLMVAAPALLLPTLLLPRYAPALNAWLLGEDAARHLGVPTERVKRHVPLLVTLGVGAAVAATGVIGFVGLVVPHLVRTLTGPDHRHVLPASAIAGAVLLVLADAAARGVATPAEVPVGLLTALLGGPFFLWLLLRRRA